MPDSVIPDEREVARIVNPPIVPGHIAGHSARRLIDGHETAFSDPFIVMAEDWMPRGAFPLHPHRGIETVTLVLEGALEHADSTGNRGLIEAGDAQWMTAGRGVTHSENALPDTIAHTLQLWVNLPARDKMATPRYQTLRGAEMPVRHEPGAKIKVLSGTSGGISASTLNHVPVTAIDARLRADMSFEQDLNPGDNAFVLVLEGEALVGPDRTPVPAGSLAWLTRNEASKVTIGASIDLTRLLLFAGPPLREPIAMGGPFVMNTTAEIQQAFADYRSGRF